MAVIETWFEQDLQKPVKVRYIDGNLFSHNGNGNRIGVIVTNNGDPVTLTGTVSGYAVLADGTTVPCTGSISGNKASVLVITLDSCRCKRVGLNSINNEIYHTGGIVLFRNHGENWQPDRSRLGGY